VDRVPKVDPAEQVRSLADPIATSLGLEIVRTTLGRAGQRWHLRVDIDRPGPAGVRLEDCETVSRLLESALDEADVLGGSYVLEVSSPGLDRPIVTDDDVRRNSGRRVVVETAEPVAGRRSFRGVLLGLEGGELRVEDDEGGEVRLPRARILKAHQEIDFETSGRGRPGGMV
jgi:ribosome maturation factor RimP